jgi:hypothetical protein
VGGLQRVAGLVDIAETLSPKRREPRSGLSAPVNMRNSVVLPAPCRLTGRQ